MTEPLLEPEHEALLIDMVEAHRRVPIEDRYKFIVSQVLGPDSRALLVHLGLGSGYRAHVGDLEILAGAGLLLQSYDRGTRMFAITPRGFRHYETLRLRGEEPLERLEAAPPGYLRAGRFREIHAGAYERWSSAEKLLWSADSTQSHTTIGHLCREALQEFAASLLRALRLEPADPDPSHTIARIRQALAATTSTPGATTTEFVQALLAYFGTVSDLVQRQEHGGTREAKPLTWDDTRRVVFYSALVMYELDRCCLGAVV